MAVRLRKNIISKLRMMVAVVICVTGSVAAASTDKTSHDDRFNAFLEEVFQRAIDNSPEFKAQLGIKDDDYSRFGDYSDAEQDRQYQLTLGDLKRLKDDFDYSMLSRQSQISHDILNYQWEQEIRDYRWRYHEYAVSQMDSVASFLPVVLQNLHQIESEADARAYVGRLIDAERVMSQIVDNIDTRNKKKIIPPKFVFPHVIRDTENIISGAPIDDSQSENPIFRDFKGKVEALDIPQERKVALLNDASSALRGPFAKGYRKFLGKVRETADLATSNGGVGLLPEGEAFYENRIENHTTLRGMTANEIHDFGLADVARIQGEIRKIQKKVGIDGSLQGFFEYARTSPDNFLPDTPEGRAEYLARASRYIDGVYEKANAFFNVLPKAPLEVRAVESWREATASGAFYSQAAPDGSRPGIYYVNLSDMSAQQLHTLESLSYHEGAPGHHFQIAIAQELDGLPTLRRFAFFGAYVEGWALYAEALGKEMGFFTDPMSDFGRLQYELLRAVRLVVDTGAHAKGWDREKIITYMNENTPMSMPDIVVEAERYLVSPGQALSYKIGMRHIQDLRSRAQNALGDDFDIRDFHDVVLRNGATPLPVLELLVNDYIAERS